MVLKVRNESLDLVLAKIVDALKKYDAKHPDARIEAYRHSPYSVRVRIISAAFARKSRAEREEGIWKILAKLPDEVVAEISLLLLLTPHEAKKSAANYEFAHPMPSEI